MRIRHLLAAGVLSLVVWTAMPLVSHAASTSGTSGERQDKIDAKEHRVARQRGRAEVLTSDITAYTTRIDALQRRSDALGARIATVEAQLDMRQEQLAEVRRRLRLERSRAARLGGRLRLGRKLLARRLVELYEADKPDLVTVVLNANGFADLLERTDFIARIGQQDRQIVRVVAAARAASARAAGRLVALRGRQTRLAAQLEVRRKGLAGANAELVSARDRVEGLRRAKSQALASTRTSITELKSEVRALRAGQRQAQRKLRAAAARPAAGPATPAAPSAGSGKMIWPVTGPITSQFCERRSWEACHPGMDIGVPEGTPIRAAAAGSVVLLQPEAASGGYGNYTCLQHSGTLATCYAHQQRFNTSMGANVAQGDIIGYVGNTGHSFGAHLHFEVRVSGTPTNPLDYL